MTQNERILRHLRDNGSITPLDALMVQGRNRYGEATRYARYTLAEREQNA